MSVTELELILATEREYEMADRIYVVPDNDFRRALTDVVLFIKEYRGSDIPLGLTEDGYHIFDPLLPSGETLFLAIAQVVSEWLKQFSGFTGELISFKDGMVNLDGMASLILGCLTIDQETQELIPADEEGIYRPYFYQLKRALVSLDEEMSGILEVLACGDYPRYNKYGAGLFLVDFVWWAWATYLGEPHGRGEGEISFCVTQTAIDNYLLSFRCKVVPPKVISISQPKPIHHGGEGVEKWIYAINEEIVLEETCELSDFFHPNSLIAFTLKLDEQVTITDVILQFIPIDLNYETVVYSCNPDQKEQQLGIVRAVHGKDGYVLEEKLLNSRENTGIKVCALDGDSFAVVFSSDAVNSANYNCLLDLFSGQNLIARVIVGDKFT